MAVATDRGKARSGRAAECDVSVVLARSKVNPANAVTVGRLLMVGPLVWLIATERLQAAFWLFLAAGLSDAIDGYIAKHFNARTDFGAYLDPLADKILLNGIYVSLAIIDWVPVWLAILVISRDLLIVVGVIIIQRRHPVFRARPLFAGKLNTFAQILLVAFVLAHTGTFLELAALIDPLIVTVALTTTLSGAGYAMQAARQLTAKRTAGGGAA